MKVVDQLIQAIKITALLIVLSPCAFWFLTGIPVLSIIFWINGEVNIKAFNFFDWPLNTVMRKLYEF